MSIIPRAMILAAGRGARMRPLTDTTPKPLLKIRGKAIIDYHLERLAGAGVVNVIINTAWLGEQIADHVGDGSAWGLQITISEEQAALETAGGIIQALPFLKGGAESADFLLLNGDVYSANAIPQLLRHELGDQTGCLMLTPTPSYLAGDFALRDGLVCISGRQAEYTYCGMARYSSRFFEAYDPGHRPMRPLLDDAIQSKRLNGEVLLGHWLDVGTPERLELAQSIDADAKA